jgi:hypothetical protein
MMTLKQFQKLAESYGADLRRWPERSRPQAQTLLDSSAEARGIIALARELDDAIRAAGSARSENIWSGDRPEAALVRLRNTVAARIGAPGAAAGGSATEGFVGFARGRPGPVRWIRLATAASVAIVAGVTLGIVYSPAATQPDLLAVLQPQPIQLLND